MADIKKIATRQAYGEFLKEYGAEREDLIVMSADLSGSNKTDLFEKEFPERFIESGISEQDMLAEAAGIAHSGHVVVPTTTKALWLLLILFLVLETFLNGTAIFNHSYLRYLIVS